MNAKNVITALKLQSTKRHTSVSLVLITLKQIFLRVKLSFPIVFSEKFDFEEAKVVY